MPLKQIDKLMVKPVNRRQFLRYVGFGAITLLGASRFFDLVETSGPGPSTGTNSYGGSSYGGGSEVSSKSN